MKKLKLIKKGPGVPIIRVCVEKGMLVVVFDERISGLSYDEDILLIRYVEALGNKVRTAEGFAAEAIFPSFP